MIIRKCPPVVRGILEAARRGHSTGRAEQAAAPTDCPGHLALRTELCLQTQRALAEPVPNTTATAAFGPCLMVRNFSCSRNPHTFLRR